MISKVESNLAANNIKIEQIDLYYPKIFNSFVPLSITGVSARTYFHWKQSNLIPFQENNPDEKGWVKLNLIEYLWIKMIQVMRDFGIPIEAILRVKEVLFSNYIKYFLANQKDFIEHLKENGLFTNEKKEYLENVSKLYQEHLVASESFEMHYTQFAAIIFDLLMNNDRGYLLLTKQFEIFEIHYFSYKSFTDLQEENKQILELPHLKIPIRTLIEDFLSDPKTEKYVDSFELLNEKEKKVIDAIRKREFKEITIKMDNSKNDIIIELELDGEILDQKVNEIRKILGLNNYSEITLKLRNNKHIFFKKKTRL